jgi:hypothetical protein
VEIVSFLLPLGVFASFLALFYVTGVWRPNRESVTRDDTLTAWSTPPMSLFGGACLLVVLTMIASLAISAPVWILPLAGAGALLVYGGIQLLRNAKGWADRLARQVWIDQGFRISHPGLTARAFGVGWILLGGVFLVVAIGGVAG